MKFDFIDLFAGIGGFHHAMIGAGGRCVFACEIDKFARKTYLHNTKWSGIFAGDINSYNPEDIPDFDVLCAGFPCQPFSNGGLKLGFEDIRGTLFFNVAQIIKTKRPKVALLENVKGLLSNNKGETFKTIARVIEELGYTMQYQVLNSKDFGVPQNRERVFMVAIRKDLRLTFKFPQPTFSKTRVGDILDIGNEKYTISDALWAGFKRRKINYEERGAGFSCSLVNEETPYTMTLMARYYKDGKECLVEQPGKNPRKLTPREAGRLQGYPDTFEIVVSDTQAYKQFGNSVSLPVVSSICNEISKQLML